MISYVACNSQVLNPILSRVLDWILHLHCYGLVRGGHDCGWVGPHVLEQLQASRMLLHFLLSSNFFQARALRALGLLLADGTPTAGGEKTF